MFRSLIFCSRSLTVDTSLVICVVVWVCRACRLLLIWPAWLKKLWSAVTLWDWVTPLGAAAWAEKAENTWSSWSNRVLDDDGSPNRVWAWSR